MEYGIIRFTEAGYLPQCVSRRVDILLTFVANYCLFGDGWPRHIQLSSSRHWFRTEQLLELSVLFYEMFRRFEVKRVIEKWLPSK